MSEVFDEGAYDYPMIKTAGDGLAMTLDYDSTIAGQTFEAGITENGVLIQAITCTVTNESAGTLVLSLASSLTAALAGRNLRWYYTRTVGGIPRTELSGVCTWVRK
jgi:hypothetical protein